MFLSVFVRVRASGLALRRAWQGGRAGEVKGPAPRHQVGAKPCRVVLRDQKAAWCDVFVARQVRRCVGDVLRTGAARVTPVRKGRQSASPVRCWQWFFHNAPARARARKSKKEQERATKSKDHTRRTNHNTRSSALHHTVRGDVTAARQLRATAPQARKQARRQANKEVSPPAPTVGNRGQPWAVVVVPPPPRPPPPPPVHSLTVNSQRPVIHLMAIVFS